MKLDGKIAVITGGNSGIGCATAKEFQANGAKLVIFGRNLDTLNQASASLGTDVQTVQGDVRNLFNLDRLFEQVGVQFGKIDVLVANAGIAKFASVENMPEDLFDELCDIYFKGTFFTVQKALPFLRDGASVILLSSADADKQGRVGTSIYTAAKAAVRSLACSMSVELPERKIRVNVLSPGMTDTPIISREGGPPGMTPEHLAAIITKTIPLRRRGQRKWPKLRCSLPRTIPVIAWTLSWLSMGGSHSLSIHTCRDWPHAPLRAMPATTDSHEVRSSMPFRSGKGPRNWKTERFPVLGKAIC
jgi:NAD(P)-dependent dehydrogenase (short-subunit alcohol dehydrogenase family)